MIVNFMDTSQKNKLFNTIPVNEKTSANLKTERKNKIIEIKKTTWWCHRLSIPPSCMFHIRWCVVNIMRKRKFRTQQF